MSKPLYIIKDWDRNFENSESRKIKNLGWAPFPNKHDSAPFRRVASLKNSPEIFAAWVLIVQVASKMPIRGKLENSGGALTSDDLSLMTGFPERIFTAALSELQKPGIQWILAVLPASPDALGDSPGIPGHVGAEGKGREGKGIEQNGTEGKIDTSIFSDPWFENPDFVSAWDGWEEMRKSIKQKPTDRARELALLKLKEISGGDIPESIKIINESIQNNWKGFFPLKKGVQNGPNSHKHEKNSREFKEYLTL